MKFHLIKTALLLIVGVVAEAKLPQCEDQVKAFNTYEVLEKGKVVERTSVFELQDWSPHSSFEGLITKVKGATISIQVVLGDKVQKKSEHNFSMIPWAAESSYFSTTSFDGKKIFNEWASGSYKVRLLKDGQTLCESQFQIWPKH